MRHSLAFSQPPPSTKGREDCSESTLARCLGLSWCRPVQDAATWQMLLGVSQSVQAQTVGSIINFNICLNIHPVFLFHFPRQSRLQLSKTDQRCTDFGREGQNTAARTHLLRLCAKWNRKIPATNKNKSFPSSTKKGEKRQKWTLELYNLKHWFYIKD